MTMMMTVGRNLSLLRRVAFVLACVCSVPVSVSAQTTPNEAKNQFAAPLPPLSADFAAVGLFGEMHSAEHYGALQSRLAAYSANAAGDAHLSTFVSPANVVRHLSDDGKWFAKLGAVYVRSEGDSPAGDMPTSTSRNALLQLLYRPVAGTLIGLGLMPDRTDVAMPVNQASVHARGSGFRFDWLQRMGDVSGVSVKWVHLEGNSTFERLLPNGQKLSVRSSTARTYVESTLTTTINSSVWSWLPQGWSLRPVTHVLFQRDDVRNPQTGATTRDFAQWMLTARLQKDVFRAGQVGPYAELGTEQEIANDVDSGGNSSLLIYGKVGAAILFGNNARLDAYYARRQAPDGGFTSNTVNLLFSVML